MKKKGLIISTIVMVVVLVASLTTATYAWFNTSAVTKIDAFEVSVATNNLVKIGFKNTSDVAATPVESLFRTGQVTYTKGTAGVLGGGTWTGTNGLSASLNHNIKWGQQAQAIGFADSVVEDDDLAAGGVASALGIGGLDASHDAYVYAANGDGTGTSATLAPGINKAVANNDGNATASEQKSDYVYMFLGVAPTKALSSSKLIILVDSANSGSATIGILAAIHVAYKLNDAANWTDVDVFDGDEFGDLKENIACNLTTGEGSEAATYASTYGEAAPTTGAKAVKIDLTKLTVGTNNIDQVQLLIYFDGCDTDCDQLAINNVAGKISIFFHAVAA